MTTNNRATASPTPETDAAKVAPVIEGEGSREAKPKRKSVSCSNPWCGGGQLCAHCKALPTPTKEG